MTYYAHRIAVSLLLTSVLLTSAFAQQSQQENAFESSGVTALFTDNDGNLVEIGDDDLQAGRFVFHMWLRDLEGGFSFDNPATSPSDAERTEFAPSFSQNLVAAYVGYQDGEGNVFPVAGAQVRWLIDEQWQDATGSTFFGAADAAGAASELPGSLGIIGNQAITLTNNGNIFNRARFPIASDYPLRNVTGLSTPDTGGVTWVTVFSPDRRARARIIAVATVNGIEIGKEIVIKNFAPQPNLQLDKTVNTQTLNLIDEEQGTVTFDVTVTNSGSGNATNVRLEDTLTSGNVEAYNLVDHSGDGFVETFDLPAGESRMFSFQATANETDTYCNTATLTEYTDEFDSVVSTDVSAQACFDVVSPEMNIIKDFINVDQESLGDNITASIDEEVLLRVRVINRGSGPANNVVINDELTSGNSDAYRFMQLPENTDQPSDNAISSSFDEVAVDTAATLIYTVSASQDGEYCNTASFTVDGEMGGEDQACLTIASPELQIDKINSQGVVLPGESYTSQITVTNTGTAAAEDVLITDLIGTDEANALSLTYVSAEVDGESGAFNNDNGSVTAPARVDIMQDASVVMNVTTRVPEGTLANTFCNVASYESANAGSDSVEACVDVPAFAALQTRMIDNDDPVTAGNTIQFTSVLYIEERSNESITNNEVTFTFGSEAASGFTITNAQAFVIENPQRNSETGAILADVSSGTEIDLSASEGNTSGNQQTVTLAGELAPDTAIFFVHDVTISEDTPAGLYSSTYNWQAIGAESGMSYSPQNSEPTTVINPR